MADGSAIEWTDATWNPVTGCSVVSPGCTNCYAMKLAGTRLAHHPSRAGLTADSKAGPVWTGETRLNEGWLRQPLAWTRPRRIFVCAHGDLFHESVPEAWIDQVFAVMALAPQHQFQVLTKRAGRMRDYLANPMDAINAAAGLFMDWRDMPDDLDWPLANVWLGVSVEDQARADARIPLLLETPAAVRFISAEPLLGPLDLQRWLERCHAAQDGDCGYQFCPQERARQPHCVLDSHGDWRGGDGPDFPLLDWVIAGGESGPGARPMHPDWARGLRDQCAAAGVPFFFKQWGEWHPFGETLADGTTNLLKRGERHGVWHCWPGAGTAIRVGKKAAGRLLDGVTHNGMPRP